MPDELDATQILPSISILVKRRCEFFAPAKPFSAASAKAADGGAHHPLITNPERP